MEEVRRREKVVWLDLKVQVDQMHLWIAVFAALEVGQQAAEMEVVHTDRKMWIVPVVVVMYKMEQEEKMEQVDYTVAVDFEMTSQKMAAAAEEATDSN